MYSFFSLLVIASTGWYFGFTGGGLQIWS